MSIASMTGFARVNGNISLQQNIVNWTWEIKSVNGKNMDLKYRLPLGFDDLSLNLKTKASEILSRGSVSAYLEITYENTAKTVTIDENLLKWDKAFWNEYIDEPINDEDTKVISKEELN
ncbi:MAG: hypothetical protein IKA30_02155, partial [Alphaproteobacteria bacterium]|nr:hypothetical protein [Alphaproteobacteria bacterium]